MKPKTSITKYIIAGLLLSIFLVCLYFYIAPVVARGLSVFRVRQLNLNAARNYYTVLSSWLTLILGVTGLTLGFFYYKDKHRVDATITSIEKKRKRLDDLIKKIDSFDYLVDDVIHGRFKDANELKHLRSKISRSFEEVVIMLELSQKLLGLEEEDVKTILRINSFVDKNDIIMYANFDLLNEGVLLSVKDEYVDLLQDARRICFKKVC